LSHLPERTEKNCLNCNARVYGKYCHICGQENLVPGESLWHLITHFFNDITHFDGKFFSTLKLLITKPGFLSGEYKRGRRASYLNPVRMYIFTSFTFFLIFFSIFDLDEILQIKSGGLTKAEVLQLDDSAFAKFTSELNKGKPMTRAEYTQFMDTVRLRTNLGDHFRDKKQYDSLKQVGAIDPGWFDNMLNYQNIKIKEKYGGDNTKAMSATFKLFLHNFPQILFVSLPLVAFFLWLIYIRKKDFYFVAHGIYSVHLYIFYFITLIVIMGLVWLANHYEPNWPRYVIFFLCLALLWYEYKAMRYFYQQGRAKTIFKYILVLTWRFIVFIVLFMAFFVLSFLKI
jgi:hypothetical protein